MKSKYNSSIGSWHHARMSHPGRNEPCHCGSGNKYKKCCESKDEAARIAAAEAAAAAAATAAAAAATEAAASGDKPVARDVPVAKQRVQPQGVSNRAPPPARRRSV